MLKGIAAWASTHTSRGRYSPVGIAFHWGMAAIIIALLWLGWYMGRLASGGGKQAAFEIHMIVGMTTLFFGLMRLSWRIVIPGPVNDADKLGLQTVLSKLTHAVFYICFIGLPLSGWLMWSAVAPADRVTIVGSLAIAPLPVDTLDFAWRRTLLHGARTIHETLVVVLLVIIPLHIGAALKHHFWDRHDVLTGMLPILPRDANQGARKRNAKPRRSRRRSTPGSQAA